MIIESDDRSGEAVRWPHGAVRALIGARTDAGVHQAAVDGASQLLGGARCKLAFADGDELVAVADSDTDAPAMPSRLPLADDIVGAAYRRREPSVVDDLADVRSACAPSAGPRSTCRSLLCVPFGDDGLLVAVSPAPAAFSDDHLDRVAGLVADAEVAAERVAAAPTGPDADRLEEVANVLAHDLASPMSVARGYLEMAGERDDVEELGRVVTALDRVDEIVERLVAFARTGTHVGDLDGVELADAARRAWCSTTTGDAALELGSSAEILADDNGLCELLENLYRNAVEHSSTDRGSEPDDAVETSSRNSRPAPEGTPRPDEPGVTVTVGLLDSGDGFYVEDDGQGIPADRRVRVFEDGYTSGHDGTGLGLGIVRRLAEAHGWDLSLTESRDGGARFEITGVERPDR